MTRAPPDSAHDTEAKDAPVDASHELAVDTGPDVAASDVAASDVAASDVAASETSLDAAFDAPIDVARDGSPDAPVDAAADAAPDARDAAIDRTLDAATSDGAPWLDASCTVGSPPAATATRLSHPAPTVRQAGNVVTMHMELNAFPHYGATDDAADIVYSGEIGAWAFSIPSITVVNAVVVASIVADDGSSSDSLYSYTVWPGPCSYASTSPPPHGVPFYSPFTDWEQVTYPASVSSGGTFTFTLENTSSLPSTTWIGVDWVEVRIRTTSVLDAGGPG